KLLQEEIAGSTQISGIQAKIENMDLELDEKEGEVARLRNIFLRLKEEANTQESSVKSLAGEQRMQEELENRLKKEKEDLGHRLLVLEDEKKELQGKIEVLGETTSKLEDEISLIEQRVKVRGELLNETREGYERAKSKVQSGVTKSMGLNQESNYLTTRIGEIRDGRERLESERQDVVLKSEKINSNARMKSQARESLAAKLEEIGEGYSDISRRRDELLQLRDNISMDLKSSEADLNVCQSRLSSLRSLTDNFEGYKVGVRTIMKAKDLTARNDGRIRGLVADVLQVEPRFEQAVEAVLADKLQYIIVEIWVEPAISS
ncbi:hypothetical protein ACFL9T_10155, partial [Thermodesulfobacteriota bacterium]